MVELSVQVVELQATYKTLSYENGILNKKLNEITKYDTKEKGKGSSSKGTQNWRGNWFE